MQGMPETPNSASLATAAAMNAHASAAGGAGSGDDAGYGLGGDGSRLSEEHMNPLLERLKVPATGRRKEWCRLHELGESSVVVVSFSAVFWS